MIDIEKLKDLCNTSNQLISDDLLEKTICTQEDASLRSPGVPAHYYRLLYFLAKELKPKLIVELGTHTGISSACLAAGSPESRVITVDNNDSVMPECAYDNIEYRVQDSLIDVGVSDIDILFIDTLHDGIRALKEYELYKDKMADNSIIFFDDINLNESMVKFWKEFTPAVGEKISLPVHGDAGFGAILINNQMKG